MARFLPKILSAARTAADFARNWRLVWAGSLADGRTIKGQAGEYRVQVLPPLRVTDDGIALDLKDERWLAIATPGAAGQIAGGLAHNVLRKASDADYDVEWFDSATRQIEIVIDLRYDLEAHAIQKRTVQVTIASGLVTEVGEASDWTNIDGGAAAPCADV